MGAALTLTPRDAVAELWRRGSLTWMLRPYQRDMIAAVEKSQKRRFFSLCSRRTGKTRTALTRAHERARKGKVIRFCYPTLLQAEDVLVPMVDEILATCPDAYRPKFSAKHLAWEYPDGMVKLAGAENRRAANRMRGSTTDDFIFDEACFYDEFEYIAKDIVMPTLLTGGGMLWLLSTPADTPGHPSKAMFDECELEDATAHYDINVLRPYYGDARIEEFIAEAGGLESTTCRREYFCKWETDAGRAVVPEFSVNKAAIVRDVPRPKHFIPAVAADTAFNDLTSAAFGYYHFGLGVIVIEDELTCHRESSMEFGRKVKQKLKDLGYDAANLVADAPLQVLADIYESCGITFSPVMKDDSDAALNVVRRYCQTAKLAISPKCKVIISHLESGVWNKSRTSFERIEGYGHFDGIDAVKYFVRHVDQHTNPNPSLPEGVDHSTHWIPPELLEGQRKRELEQAFRWK